VGIAKWLIVVLDIASIPLLVLGFFASAGVYMLRLSARSDYLAGFEVQKVGPATALEYWIPAEQLIQFNENIVGAIEVTSTHRSGS
jgi:hypothetical protein